MRMEKISQTELESILDKEKIQNVSDSLDRLRTGQSPTGRSPLYKDLSLEEVFKKWEAIMARKESEFPSLIEYERTRLSKVGPQGGYPPFSQRQDSFVNYFNSPRDGTLDSKTYKRIVEKTRKLLFGDVKHQRPWSYERCVETSKRAGKLNTNSGAPSYGRRSDEAIWQRAIQDAYSGKWKSYPAIVGSRSQRGKDKFIFMFPFSANLVEQSFVNPLMDIIRKRNVPSFSAWEGFADVERSMHEQGFFRPKYKLISMDFTRMDQSCGPYQAQFCFDVISEVFQSKYHDLLKESLFHTTTIPLMVQIDKKATGSHGLASGSGWTNFEESIDSQAVRLLIDEEIPTNADQGLGDDGALSVNTTETDTNIAAVIAACSYSLGFVASTEKQRISSNTLLYLQRFFDTSIKIKGSQVVAGCYPTVLALNSAMNPERFHDPRKWSASMEILRWIMILENCNHSPLFEDLIEFVIEGDKFKLGLVIPGFFKRELVKLYDEAKEIPNFVPSYNQASLERGIMDFDTVKYLMARGTS